MKKKARYLYLLVVSCLVTQLCLTIAASPKVTLNYLERIRAEEWGKGLYDRIVAEYEKLNPDVDINFISTTTADMRRQIIIRGPTGTIDFAEPVVPWIPQLADANLLEPIRNYLTEEDLAKYTEIPLMDGTYKGVEYAVPHWVGPIFLYINKNFLKQAGYELRGPEDILEFKEMIAKIGSLGTTKTGEKIIPFSLRSQRNANSAQWFMPWIWQWGGSLVDQYNKATLDSIGVRRAFEFYKWLGDNEYTVPGMDWARAQEMFTHETAGFLHDGPWAKGQMLMTTDNPNFDDTYINAPMPKGWDGVRWSIANTCDLVVSSSSKYKKESFDFIKWFTTNDSLQEELYRAMSLISPQKKMLAENPLFRNPHAQTAIAQLPYAVGVPWQSPKWPGAQDILATALSEAVIGGDIAKIQATAQRALEELIAE